MKINYHKKFVKNFSKLTKTNKGLTKRFVERLGMFLEDPQNPQLRNHRLTGKMEDYWSFSITGDIRTIYYVVSDRDILFVDIGTHNQVY